MHALIIEDSLLISMMVEDHLSELGYTSCDVAVGQAEAIALAKATPPDLITADDGLVEGSGIEAVKVICADRVIPTLFILGDPERSNGATSHAYTIAKPFLFDTFKEGIARAIEMAAQAE